MVGNVLSIISGLGKCANDCMCDGVGFFDKIKESVSKVSSKVTSKVPAQAKTAAAMTPQGQAVMAAQTALSKKQAGASKSSAVSVIPKPGQIKNKTTNMFKGIMKKKVFGVPVVFAGAGLLLALPMLKKIGRK